ncbi:hypothetical protein HRW11_28130 [Streptomyces lunaelactis]|nr:hypothetical protein [Streptomyces lunaelactis]
MIKFDAVNKRFPNGTTAVHDLTAARHRQDRQQGKLTGGGGCAQGGKQWG